MVMALPKVTLLAIGGQLRKETSGVGAPFIPLGANGLPPLDRRERTAPQEARINEDLGFAQAILKDEHLRGLITRMIEDRPNLRSRWAARRPVTVQLLDTLAANKSSTPA